MNRQIATLLFAIVGALGLGLTLDAQTTQNLNDWLDVTASTVEDIRIASDPDTGLLYAELTPFGMPLTLELQKYSLRADDFQVLVDDGSGALVPNPAPPIVTYRGIVLQDPSSKVRATYIDGGLTALVWTSNGSLGIQPVPKGAPGEHVIYRSQDIVPGPERCGVNTPSLPPTGGGSGPQGTGTYICEIGCDADFEYYQENGSNVNSTVNDVEGLLNAVEGIYDNNPINIIYEITTIVVRSNSNDPYTTTSPGGLLNQFQSTWNSTPESNIRQDVAHLFTGRDLNGGVIGIASLFAICDPTDHYGLSQAEYTGNFSLRTSLVAHELGHNWSAQHCDAQANCRIMCSFNGGCDGISNLTFASGPQGQIINYRNSIGCDAQLPEPQLLPFEETWPGGGVNGNRWTFNKGCVSSTAADNEPSSPRSLNLDSVNGQNYNDNQIRSNFILAAGADVVLQFYTQHKGVEAGEELRVSYLNSGLDWVNVTTIVSDGNDQTTFQFHEFDLPGSAAHNSLRIRFRVEGNEANDDWYVDDIRVTDGVPVMDPPEIDSIFPTSGPPTGGTVVTVNGSNFTPDAAVLFGIESAPTTFISQNQLSTVSPPNSPGSVNIVVSQTTGAVALIDGFTYTSETLSMDTTSAAPGAFGHEVDVFGTHDTELFGYSFGVDYDRDLLRVDEVVPDGTAAENAEFFAPTLNDSPEPAGGWWTLGVIIDLLDPIGIPAGVDSVLATARYDIEPSATVGTITVLEFRGDLGSPIVPLTFVTDIGEVTPQALSAILNIEDSAQFLRGDADGDGIFNGLADALFSLAFQFQGGPSPVCMEAADSDGDSTFNGLSDSLWTLTHQFQGGPPPPAPYPACGSDPDPGNNLGCDPNGC